MKNGKWQLAFWIMTGVCFAGLVYLSGHVIANDKESRERDIHIEEKIENKVETNQKEINNKLSEIKKEQNKQFNEILVAIAKIETKLETLKDQ